MRFLYGLIVLLATAFGSIPSMYGGESTAGSEPLLPEIEAITPDWGPSGQVFSVAIQGERLQDVREVRFSPSIGVEVHNPPTVNKEGTLATVEISIMVHAPLGPRLVTLVTPNGKSSETPTEANIFRITFAHIH